MKIHLGVDPEFRTARKAHPGLLVSDLQKLTRQLRQAGVQVSEAAPLPGYSRIHVADPFGNRVELIEPNG